MKILIVDDDKELVKTLKSELKNLFIVETAYTGEEAVYRTQVSQFDCIILDLVLPDINGLDLCSRLRNEKNNTPIIVLTGDAKIEEKLLAFANGADDYITKPFDIKELTARIKAVLRRPKKISQTRLRTGDLTIDIESKTAFRDNREIPLRRKEYLILEYLMQNKGRVLSRETILDHVWGIEEETTGNVVDVHIKYLRDRIDKEFRKKLIKTIHGLGYKIEA